VCALVCCVVCCVVCCRTRIVALATEKFVSDVLRGAAQVSKSRATDEVVCVCLCVYVGVCVCMCVSDGICVYVCVYAS